MILLDTHVWVWLVDQPDKLSSEAAARIRSSEQVIVSAISFWEFATLLRKKRIEVGMTPQQGIEKASSLPGLDVVAVDREVAYLAGSDSLNLHGDPADRIIAATAIVHQATLVTKDARLQSIEKLTTIW